MLVVDDFTPARTWPPSYGGLPDTARLHWLRHSALRAVELPLAADLSAVVATRRAEGDGGPGRGSGVPGEA
ncbi:hypothetical protein [Streptomyces sp. NPDC089799]|uniref:hypothetical protein n=1 Tax=Streptomyces sp. NPDC089799 TaxID=3155066 RepID=UPI00343A5B50